MLSTLKVENSPFTEQQLRQLQNSIGVLNPVQSQWLSGYMVGRLTESLKTADFPQSLPEPENSLAIIYATQTGNSKRVAAQLAASVNQQGFNTELHSMDSFRPAALRKLTTVAFIVSTHGEGDPPEEALEFFEFLDNERAPQLPKLNYQVLALGDRSYQLFCEAGRKLDERLQILGARPFAQRVECDVDFADGVEVFSNDVLQFVQDKLAGDSLAGDNLVGDSLVGDSQATTNNTTVTNHLTLVSSESGWSRERPFVAEVGQVQLITGFQSGKSVYHLELALEGSGLQYHPGDALGVWAPNDPEVVERILAVLQFDAAERVRLKEQTLSICDALTSQLEITRLSVDTVSRFAIAGGNDDLETQFSRLEPDQQRIFIERRQLADLVEEYPVKISPQALVELLRPLSPRSYSISSSQNLVDEEVHLTVASLQSNAIGKPRLGVASGFLNHRLSQGDEVRVFLESNDRFRLPTDPATPIIMIAAGTGIAPFRAFMQELENRVANSGDGPDSWLIFGNPHLRTDFLYQREWLRWRDTGLLNRIDTAWSRDQAEKRYVQDVVHEQAQRIEHWLQRGAHIYLCGSLQMGQAVQLALQNVLVLERKIDPASAATALAELRGEKRLQKDLY